MNGRELNRATLARQGLLERSAATPVEMVERLAGLQAQEPKPPFVGLWTRLDGFDAAELAAALEHEHPPARPREVRRGDEPVVPATNDDRVILRLLHCPHTPTS